MPDKRDLKKNKMVRQSFADPGKPAESNDISIDPEAGKHTAQALRVAYERLADILESIPDPTFVIDRNKRVIAWNHATEVLSGVAREDIIGRGDSAYAVAFFGKKQPILIDFVDELPNQLDPAYKFVQRSGDKVYAESFLPSVYGGKGAHLWGVAAPLYDRRGNRWGAIEVIRDVTDRVETLERLRESERKARAIFDLSFGFLGLLTPEGLLIEANRSALESIGAQLSDVAGKPFWETPWWSHSSEMQDRLRKAVRDAAEGRPVYFEATHRGTDGSLRYIDFSLKAVKDDAGRAVLLIPEGHDITPRRQMEQSLRENEEKYRALFENAGDAIFLMQQDRFIDCNARTLEVFGCREFSEIVGHAPYEFSPQFQPNGRASRASAIEKINAALAGPPQFFEWNHTRHDGTLFPAEVSLSRVELGERVLLQAIVRDITERKQAEEERSSLQAQLTHAQKMEAVGQLAGGVAHDFNNMLGVIIGRAELMLMNMGPGSHERAGLEEILQAARHSADLTRQLLTFARKQTVAPIILDVNDTVSNMLKMLRRLIGEEIELVWVPGADLWPVRVDPTQLDQLLVNLCLNARDAISGVGRIVIKTANTDLEENHRAVWQGLVPGQYMLLSVNDNGHGMDSSVLGRIFEPFFTTKETGKGTGLGLATVYGIVKQNEGLVNVYSEPGKGTTFKIYLPRVIGKADKVKASGDDEIPRGKGETVLLVEDEPLLMGLVQNMLEKLGYRVLAADSPIRALNHLEAHGDKIRLLVTDVVMPEMNGRELAERAKAMAPGLKCLFSSGYNAEIISHRGVLEDGLEHIQKPFSIRKLATKVREIIDS